MNLQNTRNVTIFYLKLLRAICVTKDLTDLLLKLDDLKIDYSSIELLKMLQKLIKPLTINTTLSEPIKKNLFNYINICRFVETDPEEHSERVSICNELIRMLNESENKPLFPFYKSMANKYFRRPFERVLLALDYESMEDMLSVAAELEFLVLYFHSDEVSELDFIEDASEELLLNNWYLLCNISILSEFPELLCDRKYVSRIKFILDNNEALRRQYQGYQDEDCLFDLDQDDKEIIENKSFWKNQKRLRKMLKRKEKDS